MTKETDKHGEYKIMMKQINRDNVISLHEYIVKPLTQEELADGWIQVLSKRKNIIHHFSIYISQLPLTLWTKIKRTYTTDKNKDYYKTIKNGSYHYTIKYSKHDEEIFKLYKHIMCRQHNLNKIRDLYKFLDENRVKGCVMIKAKNMIQNIFE
jgi:hypothetical protein